MSELNCECISIELIGNMCICEIYERTTIIYDDRALCVLIAKINFAISCDASRVPSYSIFRLLVHINEGAGAES